MKAIYRNSHLLKEFCLRDIRGRFAGSFGGILWALLTPFISLIIYYYVFSLVLKIPISNHETGTDSFLIYFLSGFFPWLIFSDSLNKSVGILSENANLITKVIFPVEILPTAVNFSSFFIHFIGMGIFLFFLMFQGYISPFWLLLPFIFLSHFLFVLGCSFLFSTLGVFVRDMREIIGILLMIWFYATPIIYPISMVPDSILPFLKMNPMFIYVGLYRGVLLAQQIDWVQLMFASCIGIGVYGIGALFFLRAKPAFGDVL